MMGSSESGAAIERFRASPHQRHLWALDRLNPLGPFRAMSRVRIDGVLDETALERTIVAAVNRHEILRTTFHAAGDAEQLEQVPGDGRPAWRVHDFSAIPAGEQPRAVNDLEATLSRRPLDYAGEPALSATLCRLAADAHVLFLQVPAYCCDGRGLANLIGEIARGLYDTPTRADGEVLQYVEAAMWMNESLEAPETALARQFWARQDLRGAVHRRLPSAHHIAGTTLFTPARTTQRIIPQLRIAAEPFLLILWRTLLQRHLDGAVPVIGCLSDLRGFDELQSAVGLFARALPIGGDVDGTTPFQVALRQTQTALTDARQWGESFDWSMIEPLDAADPLLRYPSFAFEHRQWPSRFSTQHGVTFVADTRACIDAFDLKLVSAEISAGVQWWIEYNTALYEHEDVERLAAAFATLVAGAASHPMAALDELPLLADAEQTEIIALTNRAAAPEAADQCLHALFEACAAATPSAAAAAYEGDVLSYADLNARANRIARLLQKQGVGPGTLVGLYLPRSLDLIASLLGTLKAGGAYLPLDPEVPAERLHTIVEESRAAVVICGDDVPEVFPGHVQRLSLVRESAALDGEADSNLGATSAPGDLAYVLFTSGSTGRPKGVGIEHRQLVSYTRAVSARLELPPACHCASVTTLASDLGNTAIFPALTTGGCLHIVSSARAADPVLFAEYCSQHRIDMLKIVPSHLKALLSVVDPARVLPRQRLVFGGEALSWELVDAVRHLAPDCRIFNHYGPTETTVGATVFEVQAARGRTRSSTVPIGRPLDHARAYVVDHAGRPVPPWTAGELLIGGAGVARGYLHSPELTRERFSRDRFVDDGEARVYRTGDLVRLLPSGDLEFLGRLDDQVKIRGYRVEPGEVSATIRGCAGVRDAVVLVRSEGQEKRLVAFVVLSNDAPATELHSRLRQALPEYMVPAALIGVEAIPLTANGKIDRAALLALADAPRSPERKTHGGNSLSEWEAAIAAIWRELLVIDEIGPQDNFYDLGGHSLLAIQVVAAIEKRTGLKIGPRDLAFNTLRQFAARCESRQPHPSNPTRPSH